MNFKTLKEQLYNREEKLVDSDLDFEKMEKISVLKFLLPLLWDHAMKNPKFFDENALK